MNKPNHPARVTVTGPYNVTGVQPVGILPGRAQSIVTRTIGWTNDKPARVRARASGGNVIMNQPMNAQCDDDVHDSAALVLCAKMRWRGVLARGVLPNRNSRVYVFVAE